MVHQEWVFFFLLAFHWETRHFRHIYLYNVCVRVRGFTRYVWSIVWAFVAYSEEGQVDNL